MRRLRVDVGASDIGFDLVAVDCRARVRTLDRV
jgi:hypothetical protein